MTIKRLLQTFVLPALLFLSVQSAFSQTKIISGKVTDPNGTPLPGASVTVKGSTEGAQTEADGTYRLTVPSSATTLVISSIGFLNQEVEIGDKTAIDVQMAANNSSLGEVVVVGYGTSRKRDLSTAVAQVTPKEFNRGVNQTADQLLQGKVPGLLITRAGNDPNAVSNVQLRGPGSLLGGANPFYVIDEIPGADINLIAPDDIATIDVLRDASATAIYGSRGANGVIVITTKRARSGETTVSYNGYVGLEAISKRIEVLNASEIKGYLSSIGSALNPADDDGVDTDWQKEITQQALSHNHNISLSGGTASARYVASLNYFKGEGIVLKSGIDRITGRLATDYKLFDEKVRVGLTVATTTIKNTYINAQGGQGGSNNNAVFSALRFLPSLAVYNEDGSYRKTPGRFNSFNPVSILKERTDQREGNTLLGIAKVGVDIITGLKYDITLSLQRNVSNGSFYNSSLSPLGEGTNGEAFRYNNNSTQKLLETYFTYDKGIGNDVNLNLVAGYSYQENTFDGFDARMIQLISDALGANNLGLANVPDGFNGVGSGYKDANKLIAFFGRAKFSFFDSRYILEASMRRDGSSRLGANNKWGNFPAVSVAWNIAEENFMAGQNIFNSLKLRAGFGTSGENNIEPYQSLSRFSNQGYGNFYYNGSYIAAIGPVQVANPDLEWQRTSVMNIGLDWSVLNSRLSGSIDVYDKTSKNLLYNYGIPVERFGVSTIIANAGEMNNRGIEVVLNASIINTQDFTWNTSANFSYNKNKIVSLGNEQFSAPQPFARVGYIEGQGLSNEFSMILQEGLPLGSFYVYQYTGHDMYGNQYFVPKDGRKNGKILDGELVSGDDQFLSGQGLPTYFYGWNNLINYKNWDLNFFFRGQGGNKILNQTAMNLDRLGEVAATNVSKQALEITKSTAPGVPIAFQPRPSTKYLEDGDFVRLDNITLGYTLPKFNNYIRRFRLYATVQNAFILTNYTGVDPELNLSGVQPGIDYGIYPKTRTFTFGVNLNF